jgi:hypothetical protein
MLVPCSRCRRHARAGSACPFCGGAPSGAHRRVLDARASRADLALLAGIGVAVALETACGNVYGGPPRPRDYSEDPRPVSGMFEIEKKDNFTDVFADFEARAVAAGCHGAARASDPVGESTTVKCSFGTMRLELRYGTTTRVHCSGIATPQCRAAYEKLMATPPTPAPSSSP